MERLARVVLALALTGVVSISACGGDSDPADTGVHDGGADADADGDADADADADAGDGCWIDPTTSLEWEVAPDADLDWNGGVSRCEALALCGKDDWSLPTIGELRSIIRGCAYTESTGSCPVSDGYTGTESCAGCAHLGGPGSGGCYWPASLGAPCSYYWSSSNAGPASVAWIVDFVNGDLFTIDTTYVFNVRCVRRGP